MLTKVGHDVVDVDAGKVGRMRYSVICIYETGLEALAPDNHAAGRLHFTTDTAEGIRHAPLQFIAVADCMRIDHIIIGIASADSEEVMRELYAPFKRNRGKIIVMDVRSAELTKYAANCMLATKTSFINEIANLGVGYGGSCFPKDVPALIRTADGIDACLLKAVERRNKAQKGILYRSGVR